MKTRIYSKDWEDYELIDAGNGQKLERWGNIYTIRPEVQAYFKPEMPFSMWKEKAHLSFKEEKGQKGKWTIHKKGITDSWTINYKQLQFELATTQFKHVGLFPEQAHNWETVLNFLQPHHKLLNLFAYTGAASIVGRSTGASVTHVDAVKQLITWAKKNMELSHLSDIRWLHEDAVKFAEKEIKRGNKYHLIIMDPPAWGIGAKNQKWKIENQLEDLIVLASQLLEKDGLLILNTYSPRVKISDIRSYVQPFFKDIILKELWKKTTTKKELFYGHLLHGTKK